MIFNTSGKTRFIVKLQFRARSNLKVINDTKELASCNETQIPKRSTSEFVSRIIPHTQGYNTTQQAREIVSKACFGVHTRD